MSILVEELELEELRRRAGLPPRTAYIRSIMEGPMHDEAIYTGAFYLPPNVIDFYDDPHSGLGDDGWSVDDLVNDLKTNGEIIYSILVGKSAHEVEVNNNHKVYAFNGNHRLAAAKIAKLPRIICEPCGYEDAIPLTKKEIVALGGTFV